MEFWGREPGRLRRWVRRHVLIFGAGRFFVIALSAGLRRQVAIMSTAVLCLATFGVMLSGGGLVRDAVRPAEREPAATPIHVELDVRRLFDEREAWARGDAVAFAAHVRLAGERDAALERLAAERAELAAERTQLAAERARLVHERDWATAERDAAAGEAHSRLRDLDVRTQSAIADIEKILASTGYDRGRAARTPQRLQRNDARGGPYIPWNADSAGDEPDQGIAKLVSQRLEQLTALRDVLVRLPLVMPVTHAVMSGGFGFRYDPFNGGAARHEGVDLRATRDATVRVPAAGTVVFAGWRGEFGSLVEVDHGFGVVTRYAHLGRFSVRKGDVLSAHQPIGVIGATGRTTGAHLHYEIRVDGQALDPARFFQAGFAGSDRP
jgi:murein DD-endopeptidase MepM/ murein hydrolase activator NlpD